MTGVIVLIDGEHHPVGRAGRGRERLRPVGAVWCGGEEKVPREVLDDPVAHYGIEFDPDEPREDAAAAARARGGRRSSTWPTSPSLAARAKLRLASLALHLGLAYETATESLDPPRFERLDFAGRVLAVIGTGKRTGKTALGRPSGRLLRERGRAPRDRVDGAGRAAGAGGRAGPDLALENLEALAAAGRHAASDYLEDAVLARVPTVGCRRVRRVAGRRPVRDERGRRRAAGADARGRRHADPRGLRRVRAAGARRTRPCAWSASPPTRSRRSARTGCCAPTCVLAMRDAPAELARASPARPCVQVRLAAGAGRDAARRRARRLLQHGRRRRWPGSTPS